MFFKIYKTTNLINGKIYIGQTHYDKPNYFGSGVLILEAIKKHGVENFIKEYIDESDSQENLDEKEIFWIKTLNAQDRKIGYNIADGGWNYFTMTTETKEKISKSLKGKYIGENAFRKGLKLTEEHKEKISQASKGKTHTEESKKKMSDRKKGIRPNDVTRKKMSDAHKGKSLTLEHRKKISESGKGRTCTEEQKETLRNSNIDKTQIHSRIVLALCLSSNVVLNFNNLSAAARHFKVTRHRIKNNLVSGWQFTISDPAICIKDLKKTIII
jgi:group I intron endonuclease